MHNAPEHSATLPRESSPAALTIAHERMGEGGGLFWRLNMSTCPHCGCTRPSVDQKLRELFAARVGMPARLNRRSDAASTNELATEVEAIEAEPIVKLGQGDFERAWGGVSGRVVRHGGGA